MLLILLIISTLKFNLTESDYKNFYSLYKKNNKQILTTYSYFIPEKIVIINKERKILINKKKENYFIFDKDVKVIPQFEIIDKEGLFQKIKNENLNKNILLFFDNKKLIKIYLNTNYNNVKEKILEIFNKREVTKDILLTKMSISNRVEIINNLKKENIEKLKHTNKLFLPIISSKYKNILEKGYILNILEKIIAIKNDTIIRAIFSINKVQTDIVKKLFNPKYNSKNKIFLFESLISEKLNFNKEKINKKIVDMILKEQDMKLLKLYSFYLPKIYEFEDIITIYSKLDNNQQLAFLEGFISQEEMKISENFMKYLIDKNLSIKYLLYSNRNNIYYDSININKYINKYKNKKNLILLNSTLYINKNIFKLLKNKKMILQNIINDLIIKKRKSEYVTNYAKKFAFKLNQNIYFRINLSLYLIHIKTNHKIFFDFINLIHKKGILKYKTDEIYISNILPELIKQYEKNDFKYYKLLFKTQNRVMIETLLSSIITTKDKRFVKILKLLLKEKEISMKVQTIIEDFE